MTARLARALALSLISLTLTLGVAAPAAAAGSVRIMQTANFTSAAALDQLYRQIGALFPSGTPVALRCLLDDVEYRSGRTQLELRRQTLCDFLTGELEARGLSPAFPSTSPRGPGEQGVLMVIEALRR